jgi:hypothetical protein
MLTMQEFYNHLSVETRRSDRYWQMLVRIARTSLDKLSLYASDLAWYWWSV